MEETKPLLVNQKCEKTVGQKKKQITKTFAFFLVLVLRTFGSDLAGQAKSQYIVIFTKEQYANVSIYDASFDNRTGHINACGHNISEKQENEGQKLATRWNWYCSMTDHMLAIPFLLILGVYCDSFGRKPLFLMSTASVFLTLAVDAYIIFKQLPMYFFLIPAVIQGVTASSYTFNLAYVAAVSDTTEPNHKRTVAFAVLDIFLGIASFTGVIGTGYAIKYFGYFWPMVAGVTFYGCSTFIILFFVQETLNKDLVKDSKQIPYLYRLFGFFHDRDRIKGNPLWKFRLCFGIFIVMYFSSTVRSGIATLYEMGYPFCWDSRKIGWYTASTSVLHSTVGAITLKLLQRCVRDDVIAVIGGISSMVRVIIEGLAYTDWMLYLGTAVGFLSSIPFTIVRALMTIMVDETGQGAMLTNYYIFENLLALGGSTISSNIYIATRPIFRGFVYMIGAGVNFFSIIMLLILVASGGVQGIKTRIKKEAVNTENEP